MDTASFTVIPAQPGFKLVYGTDDGELFPGEDVIAWRIETQERKGGGFDSATFPITIEGDPPSNWMGMLAPDGRVEIFSTDYSTLEEAQADYKQRIVAQNYADRTA